MVDKFHVLVGRVAAYLDVVPHHQRRYCQLDLHEGQSSTQACPRSLAKKGDLLAHGILGLLISVEPALWIVLVRIREDYWITVLTEGLARNDDLRGLLLAPKFSSFRAIRIVSSRLISMPF